MAEAIPGQGAAKSRDMSILNCAKCLWLRRRSVPLKAPGREDVEEEEERRNILRLGTGGIAAVVAVVAAVPENQSNRKKVSIDHTRPCIQT